MAEAQGARILLKEIAMKRGGWCVAMCLLIGLSVWAQEGQKQEPPPQEEQPPQQQPQPGQRPTLGPAPGPTLEAGPRTAITRDSRKLMHLRSLYIERIDNSLSDKLLEVFAKSGRFRVVAKLKEADGTVRGSCLESRRLKRVHSEIFISDRNGALVWQDTVYRPFNPPSLDRAVSDTATLFTEHLEESVREAERK
jgi:hypothetical protein